MRDVIDRLQDKLAINASGCLEYKGYIMPNGYASLGTGGRKGPREYIHRIMYKHHFKEIPKGMTIDHLCRNKKCANIKHLELVSHRENCMRALPYRKKYKHKKDHEPIWHKNGTNNKGVPQRYCYVCKKGRAS